MSRRIISLGAINAFFAVAAGAFAAHALKQAISPRSLEVFHTAADYQMVHAIGLILLGLIHKVMPAVQIKTCATIMFIGIILFSGSLYTLALTEIRWLGMITPLGGLCLLASWLYLALHMFKQKD